MTMIENPPMALSILQASKEIGISQRALQDLALRGEVPSVKIGRRRVFPRDLLATWLRSRATGGNIGDANANERN